MGKWLLAILAAATLRGAVLRGVVLENQTGKPLARALVELQPVPGMPGAAQNARTGVFGTFEFADIAPGQYLIAASRSGFMKTQYGQKQWNSAGEPFAVEERQAAFISIRLPRYGAITGTILDEEDVGLPGHEVVAYRNARPPELMAHAVADDRGRYRLAGLEPGAYLVRTIAKHYPEGSFLPTFAKEAAEADQAQAIQVELDGSSGPMDVHPARGTLFQVSGRVAPLPRGARAKVTFVSELGRETVETGESFRFNPVPPGNYELYAEARAPDLSEVRGAYMKLPITRDETEIALNMVSTEPPRISFTMGKAGSVNPAGFQVLVRRKDLAGVTEQRVLKITRDTTDLAPGRWELMLVPPASYFVKDFEGSGTRTGSAVNLRPDGWNEITVGRYASARFILSNSPASVTGIVKGSDDKPAVGAPVFLEAFDTTTRERLLTPRSVLTDLTGRYRFNGIAPGAYRILSTFEFQKPDAQIFDRAGARTIKAEEGREKTEDLDLYGIR